MGRPVATTPALRPVVGEAAVIVPADDPAALRDALRALLASQPRRVELAALGPPRASAFDLQHTVRAYEERYRALLAETARRA